MDSVHVRSRDRLWLLSAIALLPLLGTAGEALGYDGALRTRTTRRRTHSLFHQGCILYRPILTMPAQRLRPLIDTVVELLASPLAFIETLGPI